ncbi:lectin-like domain-containing protein, partial [Schleiferilactobacillus harbinensis]|uniref:lectin-like domain-containing protein n=1 Tax=Schleiferilactobacillus harbinensis TaxID=304207 RepID=UPI0039A19072
MGFFYIAPQLGRCILLILRFFVGIGLLSIPTFWMVSQAQAAADIPVSSSLLPLSQLAPPGSNPDSTRIYIGAEQTQDFFTPQGFATVKTNDTDRWSKISLTNDVINQYETGVVTLNTRIDMTHDFSFSWQVQMQKGAGAIAMADGIGFALHPIYAANSGADQPGKQDMTAYGRTGGNLGTADLMNAFC